MLSGSCVAQHFEPIKVGKFRRFTVAVDWKYSPSTCRHSIFWQAA